MADEANGSHDQAAIPEIELIIKASSSPPRVRFPPLSIDGLVGLFFFVTSFDST